MIYTIVSSILTGTIASEACCLLEYSLMLGHTEKASHMVTRTRQWTLTEALRYFGYCSAPVGINHCSARKPTGAYGPVAETP